MRSLFTTVFSGALVAAITAMPVASQAAPARLTDLIVFSTNSEGNIYQSLIWNTRGAPDDRWNLYLSRNTNPATPDFINRFDNASTNIDVALTPGSYSFGLFSEGVGPQPSDVHFTLNMYLNGSSVPAISGLTGTTCPGVCPAGHPNGMTIFGLSGAPEAGVLSTTEGDVRITLTGFSWSTDSGVNVVSPNWANDPPYADFILSPDYFGTVTFTVEQVPVPGTLWLLAAGIAGVHAARQRRRVMN
jgi:hypothetical protein